MKKLFAKKLLLCVVATIVLAVSLVGCGKKDETNEPGENVFVGTMAEKAIEKKEGAEFLKLEDIYFPEGLLETGLGLYIWDNANNRWVRTTEPAGKAVFRKECSTMSFAHGMGGNGTLSNQCTFYEAGYNVLSFMWGTFSNEDGLDWYAIAPKIWNRDNVRWIDRGGNLIEDDVPNATVTEIYAAMYYDLFSSFPDYSGSEIMIFGHSYGGMLTAALLSYLITSYNNGVLPVYMLPDKVNFLDPYYSRIPNNGEVYWLEVGDQPTRGNALDTMHQTVLLAHSLGIAVGLYRTSKSVCWPCTQNYFGTDVTESYWSFCNSIVYAHMSDESKDTIPDYTYNIHGYGWDWFTDYYTGYVLKDAAAQTEEEAYCLAMSYDAMFFRAGTKYDVFLSGTKNVVDDDVMTSFFCDYDSQINDCFENENEAILATYKSGKAMIAGFAYADVNGNGKRDERLKDHFAGMGVTIKDAAGNEVYKTVTTVNGYYVYEAEEGAYTVTFTAPDGYELSTTEVAVNIVDGERQLALNNVAVTKKNA